MLVGIRNDKLIRVNEKKYICHKYTSLLTVILTLKKFETVYIKDIIKYNGTVGAKFFN